MSDTPILAGYQITRQLDEYQCETAPHCITCVERDGLLVWDHAPITHEQAEQDAIKCDVCERLLVVDFLQRQVIRSGLLLRDCYQFLEYGGIGMVGWPYSDDWRRIKKLKEQLEPYFYGYAEIDERKR